MSPHHSPRASPSDTVSSHKRRSTLPPPTLAPTSFDILPALIPPIILIAGSLFWHLSPSPAARVSYFSRKGNIFNVLFVKYGWLWTTLIFGFHVLRLRSSSRTKAMLRYFIATAWWILVTQWCIGPPMMDRMFTLTGGECNLKDPQSAGIFTSAACKIAGGKWSGGHDLSGHVFLLTHAFLFLTSEVMPMFLAEGERGSIETTAVGALVLMWVWMLLMTGVYFHTWGERFTGWVFAMVEWVAVYGWGLRTQTNVRDILGVPGI